MKKQKDITVIRYATLEDCLCKCFGRESVEEFKNGYWVGHDGYRPYRISFNRWLKDPKRNCWGWADYRAKAIHLWVDSKCDTRELIKLIAHEVAHLRKPRFKDKALEEKKAAQSARDAETAYGIATEIMGGEIASLPIRL